jgi:hypothetical protein
MSIYMSFRVTQDHNKVVGMFTTLLMPSSTRREDSAIMTQRHSCSLLSLPVVSVLVSIVMNYIVVELVFLLLVVNYIVDLMICVCLCDIAAI